MRLVVGLGNPGREYEGTRHNVGFAVVARLASRHGFPDLRRSGKALVSRGRIGGQDVILLMPQTYMNLSGDAVGAAARYYKVETGDVVVVHDELDFDPGVVRVKLGGGHGGHNGLRSVTEHIGAEFARVRIGIGKPPPRMEGADYVLSRPDALTRRILEDAVEEAADAVELIVGEGAQSAMQRFNRRASESSEQ